ncbi:penicillin-binding protein 2 [Candidatus Saccharibacteria bacterium]|nr:penicillin-binding protein 2 [Candidatus Saccharibacteria bacterium]
MNPFTARATKSNPSANQRVRFWYGVLMFIIILFITRLFYLQIIRHDHYRQLALQGQLKQYSIEPERGAIKAYSGSQLVPLVLNQKLHTLYGDPKLIINSQKTAKTLAAITKSDESEYLKLFKKADTRYVILAKRLSEEQKNKIDDLKLAGIGTQPVNYRIYPQGTLASQLLGFVNNQGKGSYGVEEALNKKLAGTPGMLKAITDANGVPLAASEDNIQVDPKAGEQVVLTIDVPMQKQLERILKEGLDKAKSQSGSALIIDPDTGAVKAMANWPTYDPAEFFKVEDGDVFNNASVSSPLEVGSIMKTLTASAALNQGVVQPDTTYYDPGKWTLDGHNVTNIEEVGGPGTHNIADILNKSINTGATWLLMQMGGGEINQQARDRWHDYMVNRYGFGNPTGIEQGYEAGGYVPSPRKGFGLSLAYANTSFGQAMTATPLQMAAALSSVVNGGDYYKPHLVDRIVAEDGSIKINKPEIVRKNVVSPKVGRDIQKLMEYVVEKHTFNPKFSGNYSIGGKTGTAQIADPSGGYYPDRYNGTYLGFVGGDKPEYVITVRVNDPKIGGYAGSGAAQPIFGTITHMLIDNFGVPTKTNQ